MVDAIYDVQPVDLMGMETVAIDLTDESWYGYLAGLTADNVDKVDAAVVSEPMTGSQAYSLVLLRLKDKADAREIADSMEENISMRKWVCVEADKARVVSFDDKLLYVMADSELVDVDLLADAAAKAFGATFDVMIPSSMRTRVSCPRSCWPPRLWQTERYKKTKSRALCGARLLLITGGNQALAALISLISSGTTLYRSPTMP